MSKINLILESLAQIREVEGDPAEALGESGKVLFCIDTSSSTTNAFLGKYIDYLKNIQSISTDAKFTLALFNSDGVVIKRNISDKYLDTVTSKFLNGTDAVTALLTAVDFRKFDTVFFCTDGIFSPELTDEDIKTFKKFKNKITWVVSKTSTAGISKLKQLSNNKVDLV